MTPSAPRDSNEEDSDLDLQTEKFNLGEKKTVAEYTKLDKDDEAMNRWKASLGLNAGEPIGRSKDPICIIKSLALVVEGREDVVIDLSTQEEVDKLKEKPFKIKEGSKFHIRVQFQVNHEVLSGLKYLQVVKRNHLPVSKDGEMLGSYAPSTTEKPFYEKTFAEVEAPSGILARGHYKAMSRFIDDDKHEFLGFKWCFDVAKEW